MTPTIQPSIMDAAAKALNLGRKAIQTNIMGTPKKPYSIIKDVVAPTIGKAAGIKPEPGPVDYGNQIINTISSVNKKNDEYTKSKLKNIPTFGNMKFDTIKTLTPQQDIEGQMRAIDKNVGVETGLTAKINLWKNIASLYGQKTEEEITPVAELGQNVTQLLKDQGSPKLSRVTGALTSMITAPDLQTAEGLKELGKGSPVTGTAGLIFGKLSAISPSMAGFNAFMGTPEGQETIGVAMEKWDEIAQDTLYKVLPKEGADAAKLMIELFVFKKVSDALHLPFKTTKEVSVPDLKSASGVSKFKVPVDREWYANLKQEN